MENWKFALSSIISHKMRSFLTMLGIIIGVASVVVIMALGKGMSESVTNLFASDQQNIQIYYSPQGSNNDEENELLSYGIELNNDSPEIQEEWLQSAVDRIDEIDNYYVTNSTTATVSQQNKQISNVTLTGVNQTFFQVKQYKLLAGRQFETNDYVHNAKVMMLDTKLANKLFESDQSALNQVLTVGDNDYLIIGVYEDPNAGSSLYGAESNGNATMANTQLAVAFSTKEISSVFVHVTDVLESKRLGKEVARVVTQVSGIREGAFKVLDSSKVLADINSSYGIMTTVIGSIAGISLLVGGIGVMNIMLVSVTERTREIGLRKALGATRTNVLTQFLIEAVLLTIIGGLVGLSLALAIVYGLSPIWESIKIKPEISANVVLISMSFSAFIGVVFGILPANKASKLNPIEALRYE